MKKSIIIFGVPALAFIGAAVVWASIPNAQSDVPVIMAGATAQLKVGPFTRQDDKTPVTPLDVYCRIDKPPTSTSAAAEILPFTHFTPAATVTATLPGSAFRMISSSVTEEEHLVDCRWEWLPGTCSTTFTTTCSANGDCPGGENCVRNVGRKVYRHLVRR